MNWKWVCGALLCVMTFFGTHVCAEEGSLSGRDIMVLADDQPDGDDRVMEMTMELENKNGKKRVRSMVVYSKDYGKDSKSVFYIRKPSDVRGTAFLSWGYDDPDKDDDRWLYLPALKKSRRISGSSKNDSFMGSDLTYDDMGERGVDEDTHELLRQEEVDGIMCYVIESVPRDSDSLYSRTVSWVRNDNYIGVKREYYDRQGKLLKVLNRFDIRKVQGIWTVFKMEVENVQDSHKTYLRVDRAVYDQGLSDSKFKVITLERGSIE